MMKSEGQTPDLKEQWLQDLTEKVGHQLTARRQMEILVLQMQKESDEIEHISDRIAVAQRQVAEADNAINEVKGRVLDSEQRLTRLEKERESVEEAYERLKQRKQDMTYKLTTLPKIQAEIKKLVGNVRILSIKRTAGESDLRKTLQEKEGLEEEIRSYRKKLMRLEDEIPVMRTTREILSGKRPQQIDTETFETIQGDLEKVVNNYVDEMQGEIENIEQGAVKLKDEIEEKEKEKENLLSRKKQLRDTVDSMRARAGGDPNLEDLKSELDALKKRKERLEIALNEKEYNKESLESAIRSVDTRIQREMENNTRSKERHAYLISRKEEMEALDNVADEIQRLHREAQKLHLEAKVERSLEKTIKKLDDDTDPTGLEIRTALDAYGSLSSEFEGEILGLLSLGANSSQSPVGSLRGEMKAEQDASMPSATEAT